MRLHIDSAQEGLHIGLDIENRPRGMTYPHAQSKTIRLNLEKEQRDALKALYALSGYESGPIFWAIEEIAAEAFRAGQRMTKHRQS